MNELNIMASDLNYIAIKIKTIREIMSTGRIDEKELLSLLTEGGREINQIINKMGKTTKHVSIKDTTYKTIAKVLKQNSNRKTGVVNKTAQEIGEIVGRSGRTVGLCIKRMLSEKLITAKGLTRNRTYKFK